MAQHQRLLPSVSQRSGCPNGILDLSTVDIPHRKLPNFLRGESRADLGQERVPNLRLGHRVEVVEVKSDVDTRTEGIVDDLDPVGREEEYTTVVFEMTKAGGAGELVRETRSININGEFDSQNCDHGISHEIMKRALFHEHVRLRNC
jgi:hypothetical protein